ncbi:MAG: hypothetical protein DMF88_06450 [Acidobacteria bacterium]|nr:MAG: hypothetical protein DMF88_06450 [Acidobacteriota bacterium]
MEHDRLGRILPDGVDPREADELDATWQMLGRIDVPAPDSERMRARIDAVIDAIEDTPRVIRPARWNTYTVQGLAAAAMLVIGIGIGWFAAGRSAGSERTRPATTETTQQIAAMRTEMHCSSSRPASG